MTEARWLTGEITNDSSYFVRGTKLYETWKLTNLYCPYCGQQQVWTGPGCLCIACETTFSLAEHNWILTSAYHRSNSWLERIEFLRKFKDDRS